MTISIARHASMPVVLVATARPNTARLGQILCSLAPNYRSIAASLPLEATIENPLARLTPHNHSNSRLALPYTRHSHRSNPHS